MNFFYINKLSNSRYYKISDNYNFIILFKNSVFLKKNFIKTIECMLKKYINFKYNILDGTSIYVSRKPLGSRLGHGKGNLNTHINFYKKYSILIKFDKPNSNICVNTLKDIINKFKKKIFILKIKKC